MASQQLNAGLDYPQLIFSAIKAINEKDGANKTSISNHIQTTIVNLPATHSSLLTYHLNKLKATGELIIVKNNYLKTDPNAPVRRGRGRPPKIKDNVSLDTVSSPVVSGRKRGRPPKDGGGIVKNVVADSGERRGRGRPPKVKTATVGV